MTADAKRLDMAVRRTAKDFYDVKLNGKELLALWALYLERSPQGYFDNWPFVKQVRYWYRRFTP